MTLLLLVSFMACHEQEWGWDQEVELAPQVAADTLSVAWEWELTANEALTSGPYQMVHPHFTVRIDTFLDGDIEAPVDVQVRAITPQGTISEALALIAGEEDTVSLMADLFPTCPEATACTESLRLEIDAHGGPAWIAVTPDLVLRADVPRSRIDEAALDLRVLEKPQ